MRALLASTGTFGDLDPCLALAHELTRRGHEVTLATDAQYRSLTTPYTRNWIEIDPSPDADVVRSWLEEAETLPAEERAQVFFSRWLGPKIDGYVRRMSAEARDHDVFITTPLPFELKPEIIGDFKTPICVPVLAPLDVRIARLFTRPGDFGLVAISPALGGHKLCWRPDAGFGPYPDNFRICGSLRWSYQPDPAFQRRLQDFADAGPRPFVFSFGSSSAYRPDAIKRGIEAALRATGARAIVRNGPSLPVLDLPESQVLQVDMLPFDMVFRLARCVVHQGGSGTVHAALHAGVPSILVPFWGDQFIYARILSESCLSPGWATPGPDFEERLTDLVQRALDDDFYSETAARFAAMARHEGGAARAIDIITRTLETTDGP